MRTLIISLCLIGFGLRASADAVTATPAPPTPAIPPATDPKFQQKLNTMLQRAEKSLKLLRVQITQNQSAPFLANLYLQLGDLLSQKSNILYYLQMERDKNTDVRVKETQRFSPVIGAEQEAITIYEQILKDFPNFDQSDKVMYRLAVAQKAIDENAAFVVTAQKLINMYPKSKEAVQARLLLGQNFFDAQDYPQALTYLTAIENSPQVFERAAARYRMGLIEINQEKHAQALKHFEQVATDPELKDEDNPAALSLKTKTVTSNIKREALIDSVRAYTEVFKTSGDPVAYYSQIAPSEVLFQETIEKLAFRYIFLKKYTFAIKLLRSLSERTADSQKIMNIYHEVLKMIPLKERLDVPVPEMQFVLDKFNYWLTHYTLTPELKNKSTEFYETQVRELGTRSHDLAKTETDPKHKAELLERARGFYLLYLGYFGRDPRAVKIATNLSDVYFNEANYLASASYYMRVFAGEFGASPQKEILIQNAILALQKPVDYAFYETLRAKGLLVKAIRAYQAFDPKKKNDPALNFTLAKTFYEQGFYDHALNDLYNFMKRYPESTDVPNAAELILNYYNTRSDFKGLVAWSTKMLALNPRAPELRTRLATVRSKALLKRLDEQIKTQKGYDVFSQGKSYLQTALASGDAGLRSAAFEQALGRSKSERDIETFLKAAFAMAKTETQPQRRADLLNSMADETLAITRFELTKKIWARLLETDQTPKPAKIAALDKTVKLAVMGHDLAALPRLMENSLAAGLPAETVKSVRQLLGGAMESPVALPTPVQNLILRLTPGGPEGDADLTLIFKARSRMGEAQRAQIDKRVQSRCPGGPPGLCRLIQWPKMALAIAEFATQMKQAPTTIAAVEPGATRMNGLTEEMKTLQGSGDPQLDILLALGGGTIYEAFGLFLERTAAANPEIAPILKQKAQESQVSAQKSKAVCEDVIKSASLISPTNRFCATKKLPSLDDALRWPNVKAVPAPPVDLRAPDIDALQKSLFVNHKDWRLYFDLAELYLKKNATNAAAATATYALAQFPQNQEELSALLGCATLDLGWLNEAQYHLGRSAELNGHKARCQGQLQTFKATQ